MYVLKEYWLLLKYIYVRIHYTTQRRSYLHYIYIDYILNLWSRLPGVNILRYKSLRRDHLFERISGEDKYHWYLHIPNYSSGGLQYSRSYVSYKLIITSETINNGSINSLLCERWNIKPL